MQGARGGGHCRGLFRGLFFWSLSGGASGQRGAAPQQRHYTQTGAAKLGPCSSAGRAPRHRKSHPSLFIHSSIKFGGGVVENVVGALRQSAIHPSIVINGLRLQVFPTRSIEMGRVHCVCVCALCFVQQVNSQLDPLWNDAS